MRPKNAIGKTLSSSPSFRSNPIRTITGPMIRRQKSSRQVGVCGSALEHAPVPRKTSRIRRSRSRRLKRPLAPARRSAAVCGGLGSRAKKEPKKAYRDFQAIRGKGVVQGQSRQALMSWRGACEKGCVLEYPPLGRPSLIKLVLVKTGWCSHWGLNVTQG